MLAVAWLQLSLGEAHESDYGMMPLQRSDSLRWPPWAVGEGVADGDRRARHVSWGKGGGFVGRGGLRHSSAADDLLQPLLAYCAPAQRIKGALEVCLC